MKRFSVAEESMLPAMAPGDEFVVTDSRRARTGDVVALPHPDQSDFWLVKRMAESSRALPDGMAWVLSDNLVVTQADSRGFGPVPIQSLMPAVERLDASTFAEGVELLIAEDEGLAAIVAVHGIPEFWHRPPGFDTLVLLILEQQVSLESGSAMYLRLNELCQTVRPEEILHVGEEALRGIGVTRQKSDYITKLAGSIVSGAIDLGRIGELPANEARDALMEIKGIGPWTAEAYLLSALGHPDLFPVGDRALQVGTQETLGLEDPPNERSLTVLSQPWRPIRSVAARLIWHGYLERRGRIEPSASPPARTPPNGA